MISWEHWEGTIEYTFMAPVRRFTQMVGTCAYSIVYGMFHTAVILVVVAALFHLNLAGANLAGRRWCCWPAAFPSSGGDHGGGAAMLFTERGSQMTHVIDARITSLLVTR